MRDRIWQRMLSGRRLNLAEPSALDIEIEDIARGLSRINRWSGQTKGQHGFSVAQHSVLVTEQLRLLQPKATTELLRAALLHDAAEYVIGDMISPFKKFIAGSYLDVENQLQAAIHQRFALPHPLPQTWTAGIKRADRHIAWLEATQLAGFSPTDAHKFIAKTPKKLIQTCLEACSPNKAEQQFLALFQEISP